MRGNLRTSSNLKSTLRAYFVPFLGLAFSAAAFFGIKADLFKGLTSEANIALIFIGLFATYFFVAHVATRSKWEKFYGYAQLFSSLNKGFEEVHHLHRKENDVDRSNIINIFRILCTHLSSAFSVITRSKCSVCIKILAESSNDEEGEPVFETLCRDLNVSSHRLEMDKLTKGIKEIDHSISNNTAFHEALHSPKKIFISNKLPLLANYQNTSARKELYGEFPENMLVRLWSWPLPYKSTIVVPILPTHKDHEGEPFLGFLCIDSRSWGVFNEEYDVEVLKGVADGIYNTMIKFKEVLQN